VRGHNEVMVLGPPRPRAKSNVFENRCHTVGGMVRGGMCLLPSVESVKPSVDSKNGAIAR